MLFAFDLDGTLLTRDRVVAPSTRSALEQLRADGHHVVLASSRPPRSTAQIAATLGLPESIALNGAVVLEGETVREAYPLAGEAVPVFIEAARARDLHVNLYAGMAWHATGRDRWVDREAGVMGFGPTLTPDLSVIAAPAHKLLAMGPEEAIDDLMAHLRAADLDVDATRPKPTYGEIVAGTASKGVAVQRLAERLGLTMDEVVAFGDGENDISMLRAAGTGIAMGNARPAVQDAADHVTAGRDDDGIVKALRHFGWV